MFITGVVLQSVCAMVLSDLIIELSFSQQDLPVFDYVIETHAFISAFISLPAHDKED
jgi:hypothetical protein